MQSRNFLGVYAYRCISLLGVFRNRITWVSFLHRNATKPYNCEYLVWFSTTVIKLILLAVYFYVFRSRAPVSDTDKVALLG